VTSWKRPGRRAWPDLEALGFAPANDRKGYRRNGTLAVREGQWVRFTTLSKRWNLTLALEGAAASADAPDVRSSMAIRADDLLRLQMGRPGPWRLVPSRRAVLEICDIPFGPLRDTAAGALRDREVDPSLDDEVVAPVAACFRWLLAAANGDLPPGWAPPPRDELEGVIDAGSLVIRSGPHTAQIRVVHEPSRLALVVPSVGRIPPDLPPARRQWLEQTLLGAQARWRLVRLGVDADSTCVQAEVDLSGVPRSQAAVFLRAARDALHWVVRWLLEPVALITDPEIDSRLLEQDPRRVRNLERTVRHD
jgi:hypothetical protein